MKLTLIRVLAFLALTFHSLAGPLDYIYTREPAGVGARTEVVVPDGNNLIFGTTAGGVATSLTPAAVKVLQVLDLVENTALSTWPGSVNLVTLGAATATSLNGLTITTGANTMTFTRGTASLTVNTSGTLGSAAYTSVAAYQPASANLTIYAGISPSLDVQTLLGSANFGTFKTSLSLGNVEDTALSTWSGSANLTTFATGAVTSSEIFDGTIALGDIAAATMSFGGDPAADENKLARYGSDGQLTLSTLWAVRALGNANVFDFVIPTTPAAGRTITWPDASGEPSLLGQTIGTAEIIDANVTFIKLEGGVTSPGNSKYYGTDGTGTKGFFDLGAGSGDVTASAAFATDNRLIRSDGTGKGVQASGITIDDSDNVTGVNGITATSGTITTLVIGGVTVTTSGAELNHVGGVTSAIQGQLDAKAPLASPVFITKIQLPTAAGASTLTTGGDTAYNTTNKVLGIHNGTKEVGVSTIYHQAWSFDPKAVCDGAVDRLFLMSTDISEPFGIHVIKWKFSFEADPTTEVDLDLKRADAFIGVANSAVMDVLDTTAGASSESTAANINGDAVVATAKVLYLEFGTAYTETTHQCVFELWWEVEED